MTLSLRVCWFTCSFGLRVCVCVCLCAGCVCLSVGLLVRWCVCMLFVGLFEGCLRFWLFVCLLGWMFVCLLVCLSAC